MGWGIFGGGEDYSSESKTETTTTTITPNAGASDNSLAISGGGNVTLLEPGAVAASLDLAGRVNDAALEALSKSFKQNLDTLQQGFTENVGLTTAALNKTTLDSGERLNSLVTTLAWITGGVVAAIFLIKRFA